MSFWKPEAGEREKSPQYAADHALWYHPKVFSKLWFLRGADVASQEKGGIPADAGGNT